MTNTTPQKVVRILPGDVAPETVAQHVEDAHGFVTDVLGGEVLEDSRLERIERFVAAHRYKFLENRSLEEFQRETAQGTFAGDFGQALQATPWGQQAIEEDPTGKLQSTSSPTISFKSLP